MQRRLLFNNDQLSITLKRLCFELIEQHEDFSNSAIIGLQPRGVFLADRIYHYLKEITGKEEPVRYGSLDITFHRDDFRRTEMHMPKPTKLDFNIEGLRVILIDDVLYTGRTIRAAMDAILDYGRPAKVELLTLVERRFSRELPIAPDYVGLKVDTLSEEKVLVEWKEKDGENNIWLVSK